jgi:hypothetical protein
MNVVFLPVDPQVISESIPTARKAPITPGTILAVSFVMAQSARIRRLDEGRTSSIHHLWRERSGMRMGR